MIRISNVREINGMGIKKRPGIKGTGSEYIISIRTEFNITTE